jgi:hypothetical protein
MINSTRQLRLSTPDEIRTKISGFLGKKINIVLKDNRVIIAELVAVTQTGITVKNMRLKETVFDFDQLYEVYFDTLTSC